MKAPVPTSCSCINASVLEKCLEGHRRRCDSGGNGPLQIRPMKHSSFAPSYNRIPTCKLYECENAPRCQGGCGRTDDIHHGQASVPSFDLGLGEKAGVGVAEPWREAWDRWARRAPDRISLLLEAGQNQMLLCPRPCGWTTHFLRSSCDAF